jgi:beta-N-acetylhexosaminidase
MGGDTGRYLRSLGINVDLAPVLDVPSSPDNFLGSRAFGNHPRVAGRYGKAFLKGVQTAGVAATAKHFPGLGTAGGNTDLARIVITTPEPGLRWRYRPFAAAIRAGVRMVMVSNASYRALDPSGRPAALSRPIVTGLLRKRLEFAGVVITDAFGTPGPSSYGNASVQAVAAGVDMLLYSDGEQTSAAAYRSLVGAVRSETLRRRQLEAANIRIAALKDWLVRP